MRTGRRAGALSPTCAALVALALSSAARAEPFDDVASVLQGRCVECHNPSGAKGGLDLTPRTGALGGGDSGPAIDARAASESLLLKRVLAGEPAAKQKRA